MKTEHKYHCETIWSGGEEGNRDIRKYNRTHSVHIAGKPQLLLSTDNAQVGDSSRLNPEDLLLSALSSCHMLSYLYVCSLEGIVITSYHDTAEGCMKGSDRLGGQFEWVELRPHCVVADANNIPRALELHHEAHSICYIARSVNFEVRCVPRCSVK